MEGTDTRTFDYDDGETGEGDWLYQLSETISGLYSKTIHRDYTGHGDEGGFHIGTSPPWEYSVWYWYPYSWDGRFAGLGGTGFEDDNFMVLYSRVFNSELLENRTYIRHWPSADLVVDSRNYEANRDLILSVDSTVDPDGTNTLVSTYAYTNDTLGRRKNVIRTGQAVDSTPPYTDSGFQEDFGYNRRSELEATDRFLWTSGGGKGNRLTINGEYDYAYDNIGNRQTYGLDTNPDTAYTANDLNQYDSTTNPTEVFDYDDDGNLKVDKVTVRPTASSIWRPILS